MRIVVDTNILISGIFFGGKPIKMINLIVDKTLECFASQSIIDEYEKTYKCVIQSQKINKKPNIETYNSFLKALNGVYGKEGFINICRDSDDNKFIECAVNARADYLVSGDDDLLSIKNYQGIEIITVNEFLAKFSF